MIHLLEVSPDLSTAELKKLARKYAMTGGYEISIKPNLTIDELTELVERYSQELESFDKGTSNWRSSNAYRILSLIMHIDAIPDDLHLRIRQLLDIKND